MYFLTIPSLNSNVVKILGLTDDGHKRVKRLSTSDQSLSSPVKQRKTDGFSVKLDVKHFTAEDLTIKVVANDLIVVGKHGERLDDLGYVNRQFTRRYCLPEDIDLERMSSKLTIDGLLTIEAPLMKKTAPEERVIPIEFEDKDQKNTEKTTEEQSVNAA